MSDTKKTPNETVEPTTAAEDSSSSSSSETASKAVKKTAEELNADEALSSSDAYMITYKSGPDLVTVLLPYDDHDNDESPLAFTNTVVLMHKTYESHLKQLKALLAVEPRVEEVDESVFVSDAIEDYVNAFIKLGYCGYHCRTLSSSLG